MFLLVSSQLLCLYYNTSKPKMDLEDDTTILSTLKSFNTFISRPERPQLPSERSAGSGVLQSQYKRSMEVQINHLL